MIGCCFGLAPKKGRESFFFRIFGHRGLSQVEVQSHRAKNLPVSSVIEKVAKANNHHNPIVYPVYKCNHQIVIISSFLSVKRIVLFVDS